MHASITSLISSGLLACISLIPSIVADLTKPLIQPPIPPLDGGLWDNLQPTQSTHDQWAWGWIPDRCYNDAIRNNFSPYDIEVFNVHYTDCSEVWIMCRHHNAQMSQINMIDLFGRMPVHARQYVRIAIAYGSSGRSAYTWSHSGDVVFFGDAQNYPTLWAHEMAHSLDYFVGGIFSEFSNSTTWTDTYDRDTAISDDYANNNQIENFAQESVIALFDNVVPGGIASVEPNSQGIRNQINAAKTYLGSSAIPGGRCTGRIANPPIVCMGPAAMGPGAPCGTGKRSSIKKPLIPVDDSIPKLAVPFVGDEHPVACSFDGQFYRH